MAICLKMPKGSHAKIQIFYQAVQIGPDLSAATPPLYHHQHSPLVTRQDILFLFLASHILLSHLTDPILTCFSGNQLMLNFRILSLGSFS
jgi:hypothetical protein